MAVQAKTQRDERRSIPSEDQFGRLWHVEVEIKTGDPTCLISPIGFSDPLNTPTSMMRIPKHPQYGHAQLGKVEVDLKKWTDQQDQAENDWKLHLYNTAQDLLKGKFDPKTLEEDAYVMHQVGPKPWPPVTVLQRLRRKKLDDPLTRQFLGLDPMTLESRVALGKPTIEDFYTMAERAGAKQEAPDNYNEFVAWSIKDAKIAKNITEAALLWRAHQAALAEA